MTFTIDYCMIFFISEFRKSKYYKKKLDSAIKSRGVAGAGEEGVGVEWAGEGNGRAGEVEKKVKMGRRSGRDRKHR